MSDALTAELLSIPGPGGRHPLPLPPRSHDAARSYLVWQEMYEEARITSGFAMAALPLEPVPCDVHSQAESARAPASVPTLVGTSAAVIAAESARVLVRSAEVTIVVRNAELAEDDAVLAAFATAHELTGRRSALRELTLNGRALYRQYSGAVSTDPHSIAFSC